MVSVPALTILSLFLVVKGSKFSNVFSFAICILKTATYITQKNKFLRSSYNLGNLAAFLFKGSM